MIERTDTKIDRALLEAVRRRAAREGRDEEELIEEAVGRYLTGGPSGERGGPLGEETPGTRPWPRYPLLDSGDPAFAGRAEDELAGFGEH